MRCFSNCRLALLDAQGTEIFADDDCEVRLQDDNIAVSWFDQEGPVMFVGKQQAPDAYELVCRSRPRTATLARVGEGRFEGEWREDETSGRWRLELGEAQD